MKPILFGVCLIKRWTKSLNLVLMYHELLESSYAETIRRAVDACEDRVIGNVFNRLKRNAGLPDVVFQPARPIT